MPARLAEPTRFAKEGLTNAVRGDLAGMMGFLDPTRYVTYFNDFTGPNDAFPLTATDKDFSVARTGTGASAQVDGVGGLNTITNSAASGDNFIVRKLGGAFQFQETKRLAWGCRFQVDDALLAVISIGLQPANAAPMTIVNGLVFDKAAASAVPVARAVKASAGVSSNMPVSLANATFMTLGMRYKGDGLRTSAAGTGYGVDLFQNGVKRASLLVPFVNMPVVATLSPLVMVQNGSAVIRTMTIDWFYAAQER